jgi:Common central domain of tyrosinase/Polyphenol oxidase middle domain
MTLTRRGFAQGGAALAAAAIVPSLPAAGQGAPKQAAPKQTTLKVRRSIGELIRENSPIVESYRRGVDVMMQRDLSDKTSWWFQANVHSLPDDELAKFKSLERYWRQCPHKNYFFLSWHRAYLYFYERIVRKASGDPDFALPYWAYDDPQQATLPIAFVPDDDEMGKDATTPVLSRRNPLARANRLEHVERRWIGLSNVATDISAAMALDRFATDDQLDAQKVFGGVRSASLQDVQVPGGIEATPHNLVHKVIGLQGDLGSPDTAARDPIFWLHHANIDRLWAKWTDPARGRIPPVDDDVWMKTKFTFVDEDGRDRVMTGEEVLDTQFQLGYRYDDDPQRGKQLDMKVVVARTPAGGPTAKGVARMAPNEPVVVARSSALAVAARESQVALAAVARPAAPSGAMPGGAAPRLRVVLRDVVAGARTPPYDVYLVQDGSSALAGANAVRIGGLDLFGGAGQGAHAQHGGATLAFEAGDAVAQLTGGRSFDASKLRVAIVRRGFPVTTGGEFVPDDPDPPRIGAIELLQS